MMLSALSEGERAALMTQSKGAAPMKLKGVQVFTIGVKDGRLCISVRQSGSWLTCSMIAVSMHFMQDSRRSNEGVVGLITLWMFTE